MRSLVRVPVSPLDYANKAISHPKELLIDYTNGKIYAKSADGLTFIAFNKPYDDHIANAAVHVTTDMKNKWNTDIANLLDAITKVPTSKDAALTGTPTAPTAANGTNTTQIATTAFVQDAVKTGSAHMVDGKHVDDSKDTNGYLWTAAKIKAYTESTLITSDAMILKGTIGTTGSVTSLPTTGYKTGWSYKVKTPATYAGKVCELGDLIICLNDCGGAFSNDDWDVIQANIDGAVIGSSSSVTNLSVPIFDGTSGRIIKTSGKQLPSGKIVGDTSYGTSSTGGVVKSSGSTNKVSIDSGGVMTVNTIDATKGGTGKTSVAQNSMLYASAANVYSELATTTLGRSLLSATDNAFYKLNTDMVDGKHVDDTKDTNGYLWTASKIKAYVENNMITSDAMILKGTIGTGGSITTLPTSGYLVGWSYKVKTAGTYAGKACEIGDLIICLNDYVSGSASNADWDVIQANIDGAVTGSSTSVGNLDVPIFDGTSGRIIKTSGKKLPSGNIVGDTSYGTSSIGGVVKSSGSTNKVSIDGSGTMTVNTIDVTKGGTNKTSIAQNSMLYASAANVYSELTTTDFGRKLLASTSGTKISGLNADLVDSKHVDDSKDTNAYLWTAAKIKSYVESSLIASDAMILKGTIGVGGSVTALPTSGYKTGWSYKVKTAGVYAGKTCEISDLIICINDYSGVQSNDDWDVIQANIDGAVIISSTSVTDKAVPIFDGTSGKIIKTSGKQLPSGNIIGDTSYGTSSVGGVVKSSGSTNKVSIDSGGVMTVNTIDATKGGTGKTSVAKDAMLYASAANTYAELVTTDFGRKLLSSTSGTKISGLNSDLIDNKHVDDSKDTTAYLWTAAKIKAFVENNIITSDAMIFKGTIGTGGSVTALPTSGYKTGWSYKVKTAGVYAGKQCEISDLIICLNDYVSGSASNADWDVIQANIDGAVTGSSASVGNLEVPIFDGTSGKIIKTSSKTLPSGKIIGDTSYGTSSVGGVVKSSGSTNKVSIDGSGLMTVNTIDATKGGTGKTGVTKDAMLYASAANTYSELVTTDFGRKLLSSTSGTKISGLNADTVDAKHVDDAKETNAYLWTAAKIKAYVESSLIASDAMIFKGTIGSGGSVTALPTSGYKTGWSYKVKTAGVYAGKTCEISDLIICLNDYVSGSASNDDWDVIQANIDGAVIGSSTLVNNLEVPIFDGTSGRIIKTSGKQLPSGKIVGDTSYGTSSVGGVVKSSTSTNKISIDSGGIMTVNTIGATKGGTGKTSIAKDAMLYASAANTYSELATTDFGRKLLASTSGTLISGLNADTLDGKHISDKGKAIWDSIPIISDDGIMEIGRYLDFHMPSNDTADYTYRLSINDPNELVGNKRFRAPELKATSNFNINDKAYLEYNDTDECIQFRFA